MTHLYGGVLPCPWPLCPNGIGKASFGFEGTIAERIRVLDADRLAVFAWVVAGVTTAHVAAQLTRRVVLSMHAKPTLHEDGYLYHFTSETAARQILQSSDLWMMDYRDFTDFGEIRHGLEVARATIGAISQELHDTTRELLDAVLNSPLPESVYVTCFCMLRDSPYHWKEYAADGGGAALVIDPAAFDAFLAVDPFTVEFTRVLYTWDTKAVLFAAMARNLDTLIRFDISRDVFKRHSYLRELAQLLGELLPMCKDVSFLREHEIRVVFSPRQSRVGVAPDVHARSFNGRRYVTMRDVLPQFRLPVDQVIVGPEFAGNLESLPIEVSKVSRAPHPRSG